MTSAREGLWELCGWDSRKLHCRTDTAKGFARLQITATCIRVPIMRAHAESINLEFEREISEEEAVKVLEAADGVSIINDRTANRCIFSQFSNDTQH